MIGTQRKTQTKKQGDTQAHHNTNSSSNKNHSRYLIVFCTRSVKMPHRSDSSSDVQTNAMYVNGLSEEAASRIMRPMYNQSGVVTPQSTSKPWLTAKHPGLRGWMPVLDKPKSTDSSDRSVTAKHDDGTVATLTTEPSADEREATANALLLVSTAAVRHGELSEHNTESFTRNSPSNVPIKKRKKHLDVLRRNGNDGLTRVEKLDDTCQISPVSHLSVEGRTVSHEEATPQRKRRLGAGQAARSQSFDSKDSPFQKSSTQELLDSSKINSPSDIPLPAQVMIPHFPSVLHQMLSDPDLDGSVVTWLPDGESWKVLRWDALRREVLPRYFSHLRDETGSSYGTIDAFLWHLSAWGFEEVKDGSTVGAYRHDLFIRGAQKLSNKMKITATAHSQGPKTVSPIRPEKSGERALLQVPTLASSGSHKRPRYDEQTSSSHLAGMRRSPLSWVGYREDPYGDARAWGHYYADPSTLYPGAGCNDHRYVHGHPRAMDPIQTPMYSPPQVRSGRGAMRIAGTARTTLPESPVNTPASNRSSFPVSNRGKARKTAAARPFATFPETKADTAPSSSGAAVSLEEAQRIGNSVKGVAIAISRKTKRKLPLARNSSKGTEARKTPEATEMH